MIFEGKGIILSTTKFQERSLIVSCFFEEHGVFKGLYKPRIQKGGAIITVGTGDIVHAKWQARLSEQLGTFQLEVEKSAGILVMGARYKPLVLQSAIAMTQSSLNERDPQVAIFSVLLALIEKLHSINEDAWTILVDYTLLELELLNKSGFGMDLSQCIATGERQDLVYVSPKSACAVGKISGEPYKDKLLPLPEFILKYSQAKDEDHENLYAETSQEDVLLGLQLTGYFLNKHFFLPADRPMPRARQHLEEYLTRLREAFSDCTRRE
jgi:DNA repair protein RecO (recombination protein O)